MPISSIFSTDYSTRTKDVSIFQGVDPTQLTQVTPSFGHISQYCAGIQKLIQRYSIALLSAVGSQSNYPTFGTALIPTLSQSSRMNINDIHHVFNFANLDVLTAFRNYQRTQTNLPLDEQLDTAVLINITSGVGSISLTIQIYPLAGDTVTFILPVPETT